MIYAIAIGFIFLYSLIVFLSVKSPSVARPQQLGLCVFFGMLSAFFSLGLEFLWNDLLGEFISSHSSLILLESFIGVGLIEELMKWIWLVFVISRWRDFIYYANGIVYASGIAAGFNLVESMIYIQMDNNLFNMVLRGLTAIPVHFLFAIVMGFLFARFKFEGKRFLWVSLLIPTLLHGLYDFFIFQTYAELLMGASILVLAGCLALAIWICRIALKADRWRLEKNSSFITTTSPGA